MDRDWEVAGALDSDKYSHGDKVNTLFICTLDLDSIHHVGERGKYLLCNCLSSQPYGYTRFFSCVVYFADVENTEKIINQ